MKKFKSINYIHFDSIDSTNTWAKNNAHSLDSSQFTCITSLEQTHGRGRLSRRWISPKGQNIYATLFFCVPRASSFIANIGQVLSLSCATVLKNKGFSPLIKWPNDILLEGKKVAGTLCETVSFDDRIGIVLGFGINVNMSEEFLKTIDQPATSLAQLSGQPWTLEQILGPLLQQFLENLQVLEESGFEPFCAQFEDLLAYKGQTITCNDGRRRFEGTCLSINKEGRLNLLLPTGERTVLSAGEILTS